MKNLWLIVLTQVLLFRGVLSVHSEPVNVGNTTTLSIGYVNYSHINIPPAWAVESPDILELVGGQNTTSIRVKGLAAGTGIVRCVYVTEKYDSTIKMWVVDEHYDKFFYVTVTDATNPGGGTSDGGTSGGDTSYDPYTITHNLTMYVGQEAEFEISIPDDYIYISSDTKCKATWNYDSFYFERWAWSSTMKMYGLKAIQPTSTSTTVTANYALRKDAKYHYRKEVWNIEIKPLDVTPASIELPEDEIEMYVGESIYFNAAILPVGSPQEFVWVNHNPELISITSTYKTGQGNDVDHHPYISTNYGNIEITANQLHGGEAFVSVQCPFKKVYSSALRIKVKNKPVESLSLPQNISLEQGTILEIEPTIMPIGADRALIWSSEKESVAKVDEYGYVFGISAGTTKIHAKSNDGIHVASTEVTVIAHQLQLSTLSEGGIVPYKHAVTLSASREAANIYYTLNGKEPTTDDFLYQEPIEIEKTLSLKAKAFLDGYISSETIERSYQVKLDINSNIESGIVAKGQQLVLTCSNPNANIYYTADGSTPNSHSLKYIAPLLMDKDVSIKAMAICEGCIDSDIIEREFQIQRISLSIYPQTRLIGSSTQIKVVSTPDATIKYTTDGSEPTEESQTYSSGIYLEKTSVLKIFAYKDGYLEDRVEQFYIVLEGKGSSESPYLIKTPEELYAFSERVNSGYNYSGTYIKLNNDIDLNPGHLVTPTSEYVEEWVPIGTYDNKFYGYFDGDGHTVSGIYVNQADKDNVGLFGYTYGTAQIKNTIVSNSYIRGNNCVGGIVGNGDIVFNCINYAQIEGSNEVGGISGFGKNISNCSNFGDVIGHNNIGGIAGLSTNPIIYNCGNYGTINGPENVGGICGSCTTSTRNKTGYVSNCYNMGDVYGGKCGGITGISSPSGNIKLQNCVNYGTMYSETRGAIAYEVSNTTVSSGSYLETSCPSAIIINNSSSVSAFSFTESEMRSDNFLNRQNSAASQLGKSYSQWKFGVRGFPVLDFVNEEKFYEEKCTKGDVNGDGKISVTDVVSIIDNVLEQPSVRFIRPVADMNGDGKITVTDAISVIDIILTNN